MSDTGIKLIPYARQLIEEDDIQAVVDVLRSDWLTTGPKVSEFEKQFSKAVFSRFAVAVSSGTAGLHAAMYAVGIGRGDEVIVPSMTFAATANCVVHQGGIPVFADVNTETLLIDPVDVERKITAKTKAIIAVDYAGQPCDYDILQEIADRHKLFLVADACHALGAEYNGRRVGTLADLSIFSFHPVKHITTGEGGMISTDNAAVARKLKKFRNHGIDTEHYQRRNTWYYEMVDLGYNYRLSDIHCALGISQLKKNRGWLQKRHKIAERYDMVFNDIHEVRPLTKLQGVQHAYHLYVVRLELPGVDERRQEIFESLRANGIGVNVHYIPVHLHPFYRNNFGTAPGDCPVAEQAYKEIISLPIYPGLQKVEQERVISQLIKMVEEG